MTDMFYRREKRRTSRGFTMVEMLIAVTIFTIALSSLISVSANSLKASRTSQESLIGNYLTMEAVELVHNIRDQALLNRDITDREWYELFGGREIFDDDGCFGGTGTCNFYIDNGTPKLAKCSECKVFFDDNNKYYYQTYHDLFSGGEETPFHRTIRIAPPTTSNADEIYVLVETTWPGGGVSYGENLYLYQ